MIDIKNLSKKEIETLALSFTITKDTVPITTQELRNELVEFVEFISNIKEI